MCKKGKAQRRYKHKHKYEGDTFGLQLTPFEICNMQKKENTKEIQTQTQIRGRHIRATINPVRNVQSEKQSKTQGRYKHKHKY